MRIVYISCNVSILPDIIKILNKVDVDSYQVIDKVNSVQQNGNPRLNTAIWPGYNSVIFVSIDNNDIYNKLIQYLKLHNSDSDLKDEKIMVCSWQTDDFFWE